MTQTVTTQEPTYLEAFERFQQNGPSRDPTWVQALRRDAIARFQELGFPIGRRGNEEWKYTDIRPIARSVFTSPTRAAAQPMQSEMRQITFGEDAWHRLVFVDGMPSPELSSVEKLPPGVKVMDIAEAMVSNSPAVQGELARHMAYEANPFAALNTAFVHHGAYISIPDGALIDEPIHIIFITSKGQETALHPRALIVTGKDSSASVVQSYVGLDEGRYLSNAVVEVALGRGSSLKHYTVQRHSERAYHIANTQVVVAADAFFSSVNFDFGGGLVRNNLNVLMAEEGGSCLLNGLYMPTDTQHIDNQVIVDHAKGHTDASELYKGILNGKARSVFHGSIIVREGSTKVNASQTDKNLLLSPEAEADTKPAFWIYCDDVKCAHGASCGQIDEDAMFYLRSRGLSEAQAKRLLIGGFVAQIIDSVELQSLRGHMDNLVHARLGAWLEQEGLP